jgi:hypothetical protein
MGNGSIVIIRPLICPKYLQQPLLLHFPKKPKPKNREGELLRLPSKDHQWFMQQNYHSGPWRAGDWS